MAVAGYSWFLWLNDGFSYGNPTDDCFGRIKWLTLHHY